MSRPVFSSSWYRVVGLTPRLRGNARIHRHQYRGETWYVVQDAGSERMHRLSPTGYLVVGLMDGRRAVQELWELAATRLGDDAPTQDEMIQLLAQLQAADVLQCDVPPDTAHLLRRYEQRQRRAAVTRWLSPLSWRIPLFDPERFLRAFAPVVAPCFSIVGSLVWIAVVGTAVVLTGVYWRDLTEGILDRLLSPQHAAVLWLCFPLVKALHEFGHAFAVKVFGGEVHDMGVMMLLLTPVPYVDASAATAFRSKWQRMVVGLAGMGVELFLAACAMFVWLMVEPGLVRTVAYNVILVAGISTLLFNINPLLRYDGYYVVADLLEIPNLYSRSRAWLRFLLERWAFGRADAEPPLSTPGERAWFAVYAVSSFLYRVLVVLAISFFLMEVSFYLGALFGLVGLFSWIVRPASQGLSYLFTSPRLRGRRPRAIAVSAAIAAVVVGTLTLVPVPLRSRAEGVVWIPEDAFVRAGTEGFIERLAVQPGTRVRRGDVLLVLADRELETQGQVLAARVRGLEARLDSERPRERVKTQIVEEELAFARQEQARVRERLDALRLRARTDGVFVVFRDGPPCECMLEHNLKDRFVKKGELVGYVLELERLTVRAVVNQSDIDLVRHRTLGIEARLSERLAHAMPAVLKRLSPRAVEHLPSPALGTGGGGVVPVDPADRDGTKVLRRVFQADLELAQAAGLLNVGGRVYVRFDHGREPLAAQWYRDLRQLFLARFNV